MKNITHIAHSYGEWLLRWSLGITFVWFGVLKLVGMSPVTSIIFQALPVFLSGFSWFFFMLGVMEILIGIGFLIRKTAPYAAIVLLLHLLIATGSVLVTQGFSPSFPFLTLEGEFVIKNLILMAAGVVILGKE